MSSAYVIQEDGQIVAMKRVRVRNEPKELQSLLEQDPNLLPGDQIRPEEPCCWLPIAREMNVPDPTSGVQRWQVDFLFVDQKAVPTFVECKRHDDTRSRREVVGQILEYAANGHYYWDKETIRDLAETNARSRQTELEDALRQIGYDAEEGVDQFFQTVEDNLREGQIRLVFFLEEAPMELKSIVDFLNRQMERTEVLLVEARQYEHEGLRIVVPSLFGYTEEARRVKRTVTVSTPGRRRWDEAMFFEDAKQRLGADDARRLREFYNGIVALGPKITWGTGALTGSFGPAWPLLRNKTVFTVFSDGKLALNFGAMNKNDYEQRLSERLHQNVQAKTSLSMPLDFENKYPTYSWAMWKDEAPALLVAIKMTLSETRTFSVE